MQPANYSYIDAPTPPPYFAHSFPDYPQLQQPVNPFIPQASQAPSAPQSPAPAPVQMQPIPNHTHHAKRSDNAQLRKQIAEHKARIEDLEHDNQETKNCIVCCVATSVVSAICCGM